MGEERGTGVDGALTVKVPRRVIRLRIICIIRYPRRRARSIHAASINPRAIVLATSVPRLQLQETRRKRLPALTLPRSRSNRCSYRPLAEEIRRVVADCDFVREWVAGCLRAVCCCRCC